MEINWSEQVLGGEKELKKYIEEIKLIPHLESKKRALKNGTKGFLYVLAKYLKSTVKQSAKKNVIAWQVANIIHNMGKK